MSVSCDKILGYCVDITNFVTTFDNDRMWDVYDEYNFDTNKKVKLVIDGMNGDYAMMFIPIAVEFDTNESESLDFPKKLNKTLKMIDLSVVISEEEYSNMKKLFIECFKEITDIDVPEFNIEIKYLEHFR